MLRNHLLIAIRNFRRFPLYSLINVSGLVLGLCSSLFILLWILDEYSYNTYHQDNDRVYKLMQTQYFSDGSISTDHWTPAVLSQVLKSDIPEVEVASRLAWSDAKLFNAGEFSNYEYGNYADQSIFEVLNISLKSGNDKDPIPNSNSIAISQKMANRYFNNSNAIGKTFRLNRSYDVTVTAVFEDLPKNVSEEFDFILPFQLYVEEAGLDVNNWDNEGWLVTYVKLNSSDSKSLVNDKIRSLISQNTKELQADLFLFSMKDWRLYSNFENGEQAGGRISYVIAFVVVALFILLIACVNFMNLSTARSAVRTKEVGVRKVAGATRGALVRQFMSESIFLTFISMLVSLMVVHLLLPTFNELTGKTLVIDYTEPIIYSSLVVITLVTGFLAGSYPAYFLSSFRPALVLKGVLKSRFSGTTLRKSLVVFQFGLSMIIIVCALVVHDQINYMRNKNLGFDRMNVIYVRTNPEVVKTYESMRNEMMQHPSITSVSMGAANPMEINGSISLGWNGKLSTDDTYFNMANCDYDYLNTMGFNLIAGRNFSPDFPADSLNLIVTESVVKKAGFENPIGEPIKWDGKEGQIIGVIEDFHNLGIQETLQPTVLNLGKGEELGRWASIFIRYMPGKETAALDLIRESYKAHNPDYPIQWNFLDEDFEYQFQSELTVSLLSKCFTIMAIIISCLGLFGLALFDIERRRKEISIRKVLGASTSALAVLLCNDFVRLVTLAILIGSPIAYYLSNQFLKEYAYHAPLNLFLFVLSAMTMFILSIGIISFQSIKAARSNPVDAMRSE